MGGIKSELTKETRMRSSLLDVMWLGALILAALTSCHNGLHPELCTEISLFSCELLFVFQGIFFLNHSYRNDTRAGHTSSLSHKDKVVSLARFLR